MQLATTLNRPNERSSEAAGFPRLVSPPPSMTVSVEARRLLRPVAAPSPVDGMAREHYAPLLRFATRLTGNEAEARDLVQDTFERALVRISSFQLGTNERAWLQSILSHAFLDGCRRRAVRKTVSDERLEHTAVEPEAELPEWASISAEQLGRAMGALEPEFQQIYRLHAVEQRSYKEIAETLAIPINTVGTRLLRARQKLKTLLEEMARVATEGAR